MCASLPVSWAQGVRVRVVCAYACACGSPRGKSFLSISFVFTPIEERKFSPVKNVAAVESRQMTRTSFVSAHFKNIVRIKRNFTEVRVACVCICYVCV